MKLQILGSSSDGNAYLLKANDGTALGIDLGVNFKLIKQALDFDLTKLVAVVSHSHGDHSKGVKEALNSGVNVYSSKECFNEIGVNHHRAKAIEPLEEKEHEQFKFKAFELRHDVKCYGYLISHPEMGNALFVTDTMYVPYTFPELNNIIIEANYSRAILDNMGDMKFLKDRIKKSHLSLEHAVMALKANDMSNVNNIVLIHLSDRNSHAEIFKTTVENATGKNVFIADAGMEIDFNRTPF